MGFCFDMAEILRPGKYIRCKMASNERELFLGRTLSSNILFPWFPWSLFLFLSWVFPFFQGFSYLFLGSLGFPVWVITSDSSRLFPRPRFSLVFLTTYQSKTFPSFRLSQQLICPRSPSPSPHARREGTTPSPRSPVPVAQHFRQHFLPASSDSPIPKTAISLAHS
jgi:hypothetical protein